jgi:hypothetical protein
VIEEALIRPVGHLLPYSGQARAREKAKFYEIIAFARERSEWEKVADRPDEGLFAGMTN